MYVRVSSKEQEREGFSIPAQKKSLIEYAEKRNFKIVKIFEEAETAKKAGRRQFQAMLEFLKAHKDVTELLVEKTDRLYRNFKDYGMFDESHWSHLSIHLTKENEIVSQKSKSGQKFIHAIKVLVAKNFIDNLSEEVQKGMTEKAQQGLFPSCAPIGYINNKIKKTIEPDPAKAPLIKKAFELASTGQYSISKLNNIIYAQGLRSVRSNSKLSKSQIHRVLVNPIHYGYFSWNGTLQKGSHQAIITKDLFDRVQNQMGLKKRTKSNTHSFAFGNVMTCSHCGASITGEIKKKKSGKTYTYYHCTSSKDKCFDITYIREEKINTWFTDILTQVQIPAEIVEWTRQALLEVHDLEKKDHTDLINRLNVIYKQLQTKIDKAYEDKLNEEISKDYWASITTKWKLEQADIELQLTSLREVNTAYIEQGMKLMELAQQAPVLFQHMTTEEKREMVNLVLSNPKIKNGSIEYDLRKPFSMFSEVTDLEKWRSERDSNPRPSA